MHRTRVRTSQSRPANILQNELDRATDCGVGTGTRPKRSHPRVDACNGPHWTRDDCAGGRPHCRGRDTVRVKVCVQETLCRRENCREVARLAPCHHCVDGHLSMIKVCKRPATQ
jgi:hypothetical protein